MKLVFNTNDALVMQSVYFGQRFWRFGASLKQIIAIGDAIDRTIHEYEDLKSALSKLSTAGLIQIKGEKVFITSLYRTGRKEVKKRIGKYDCETDLIIHVLKKFEQKELFALKDLPEGFLTKTKWSIAYSNYKYDFQKQLDN